MVQSCNPRRRRHTRLSLFLLVHETPSLSSFLSLFLVLCIYLCGFTRALLLLILCTYSPLRPFVSAPSIQTYSRQPKPRRPPRPSRSPTRTTMMTMVSQSRLNIARLFLTCPSVLRFQVCSFIRQCSEMRLGQWRTKKSRTRRFVQRNKRKFFNTFVSTFLSPLFAAANILVIPTDNPDGRATGLHMTPP